MPTNALRRACEVRLRAPWGCAPAGQGAPLFRCAWRDAVFFHYEADPAALRPYVPFELDLYRGKAYVSVVTITIRPIGLRASAPLLASQSFLNVRTYVKVGIPRDPQKRTVRFWGEPPKTDGAFLGGITFLAGWLPNPLCALLGPRLVGIPYRFGRLALDRTVTELHGRCSAAAGTFEYRASIDPRQGYRRSEKGSLEEFLFERYAAFTRSGRRRMVFRTWHEPWTHVDLEPEIENDHLLLASGPWTRSARLVAAHHSPGFDTVWMGALAEVKL
jgi:hypothetical protein